MNRWLQWAALWLIQAGLVSPGWAGVDDDFQKGLQEYNRGDVTTAMSTLRPGVSAGHAPSQTLLAFILDKADFPEDAARLYKDAAAQGNAEATASLAGLYLTGRGVPKDEKLAFEHFSKAADMGHGSSILAVADAFLKGSMGQSAQTRDNSVALKAIRRAADAGHGPAAEGLAQAYQLGGFGLTADAEQSALWRARAEDLKRKSPTGAGKGKP